MMNLFIFYFHRNLPSPIFIEFRNFLNKIIIRNPDSDTIFESYCKRILWIMNQDTEPRIHVAISPWDLTDDYNRHAGVTLLSFLDHCPNCKVTAHILYETSHLVKRKNLCYIIDTKRWYQCTGKKPKQMFLSKFRLK